jgi:HEAT repeat protein
MIRHLLLAACAATVVAAPVVHAQQKTFLNRTAGQWVTVLSDKESSQRRSAAFALGKLNTAAAAAVPSMKAAYAQESDTKTKDALLFALGEICRDMDSDNRDATLEPIFIAALNDSDMFVRRSAVYGLGCLANKSTSTRKALANAVSDREPIVRQNAAWAVGRVGIDGLMLLRTGLHDADAFVKRDAASALLQMEDGDKVRELLKDLLPLCRDNNSEVRRAALNVLVRIVDPKDKEAIASLRSAIEDRDVENRRNAALALCNIGGEETAIALPVLIDAIKNGDEELRRQATLAIRNIGPSAAKAVPELTRLLREDRDPKMREHAALAIGGIGAPSEPAIPLLVSKLKDTNELRDVRIVSAVALMNIGPVKGANAVAPELLTFLGDPRQDGLVRERVEWALRVHGANLRTMKGYKETLTRIVGEPRPPEFNMLRYHCAYMLGSIWGAQAPDGALDVLTEFINDDTIKIIVGTKSSTGPTGNEVQGGKSNVQQNLKGDGRVMACDALQQIGAGRYASRQPLMNQLKILAADKNAYPPLRTKAAALVKAAQ